MWPASATSTQLNANQMNGIASSSSYYAHVPIFQTEFSATIYRLVECHSCHYCVAISK